jgi:hypothetical protein
MPRKRSNLTDQGSTTVRLTPEQRITLRRLGGAAWLREQLDARYVPPPTVPQLLKRANRA